MTSTLGIGTSATINYTVAVQDEDYLSSVMRFNGWIDWNRDGDFLDAGERIATNDNVSNSGAFVKNITVPAGASPGVTFARFRIGPSVASSTANAAYGEVEDYQVIIGAAIGIVSGHLYLDTNGNGVQNIGEPNLPNIDIIITDANNAVQTVSTDSNGDWTASVPPGTTVYLVTDTGVRYPVAGQKTLDQLGLTGVSVAQLPAALVGLLPQGPLLDPAAAALPVA